MTMMHDRLNENFSEPIRLLVIDDDEEDYMIVRAVLDEIESVQFDPAWAATMNEAISLLIDEPFDLCLLDYSLGNTTGIDVLRRMRSEGIATPTIFLTGHDDPAIDHQAMEEGAADFLSKADINARILERKIRYARVNAERMRDLEILVSRDPLTGLANRREFEARIDQEIERHSRSGAPLSLALLDIDFFKRINDSHGHDMGDSALKTIAKKVRKCVRGADLVARYGGEEFAVLMPDTKPEMAFRVAERIRKAIGREATLLRASERQDVEQQITLSVGIAAFPDTAKNKASLIVAADRALYDAKRAGRDRVVMAIDELADNDYTNTPLGENNGR